MSEGAVSRSGNALEGAKILGVRRRSSIRPDFIGQVGKNKSVIDTCAARSKGNSPISDFQTSEIQFV
jgi:hypothetical protein